MKMNILLVIGLIAITDLLDTISQLILKSEINRTGSDIHSIKNALALIVRLYKNARVWASFTLAGISLVFWLFVLSKTDLSMAFSIDSMRYVMIAAASIIFLKERFGSTRWLGIASVVLGIVLVTLG
ncbi:MAG: EamA family transporter [Candidatus Omnitrophota bacterium]